MLSAIAGEVAFQTARAHERPVRTMLQHLATIPNQDPIIRCQESLALGQVRLDQTTTAESTPEPVIDDEHHLAIVFDGRLLNRDELFGQLTGADQPRVNTDAHVVLAAYRKWGERFAERLHGHFAIVLVDQPRQHVVLCRDRLGVKPLYLAQLDDRLRFASSLPALAASGGIDTSIDKVGLHHYMSWHSIVPAPRTLITGITSLPPATVRVLQDHDVVAEHVYWQPDYSRSTVHRDWDPQDWQNAIHQGLQTAVERTILSKERMDVLLSGGLDSSLLVALLVDAGVENISTFSVGFDAIGEHVGNEFEYSNRVAEVFGTDHHTLRIGTSELYDAVDDAIAAMTEPMASHDVPAFYLHAQHVGKQSAGVQCGQGADEIFAGYRYHRAAQDVARDDALATFLAVFQDHDQAELATILNQEWLASTDVSRQLLEQYVSADGAETAVDAVLRLETQVILADDPVKRVSSMSMAAGLESFLPFLDHEFIELVIACPPELRTAQDGKGILKNIGRELLPNEVIDRPKGYFPVPGLQRLEEPFFSEIVAALRAPQARERALFRPEYVEYLLAHPNDHYVPTGGNLLWKLGLLEMWLQRHGLG